MDGSKLMSSPEGSVTLDPSLVSEDGKNVKAVLCQRCGSKVLCPGMALFAEKEVSILSIVMVHVLHYIIIKYSLHKVICRIIVCLSD